MGRKSKLTPEQWQEIKRRHIVDGESVNSLAKEYEINEKAIRRYLSESSDKQNGSDKSESPNMSESVNNSEGGIKGQINSAAVAVIDALKSSGLPQEDQSIALDVAARRINNREVLDSTAENMNKVANVVSKLAIQNAEKLAVGEKGLFDADQLKQM